MGNNNKNVAPLYMQVPLDDLKIIGIWRIYIDFTV